MKTILTLVASLFWCTNTFATGVTQLQSFVRDTRSLKADFTQQVMDKNHKVLQQGSGLMEFSRPGKFRWVYNKPYEQLIVGDGEKLWVYDKELNQVTVKKLANAIGGSPAALLAGQNEIEKNFELKDLGEQSGLTWLEATPKAQDTTFQRIRMAFSRDALTKMELYDNFGQMTVINFSNMQRNPKLPTQNFKFTPPKGADVVGE